MQKRIDFFRDEISHAEAFQAPIRSGRLASIGVNEGTYFETLLQVNLGSTCSTID